MSKLPKIIPVSDLRQDAAAVLRQIRDSDGPTVITQRGRAAAILLSPEAFAKSENERELLLQLARGEKEINQELGYDLDSVLAEVDEILQAK
ncbi:MAG: prevent-host-death family protein [Candidatus Marinimicrobia bacterium CG_4_10_14_0_2_um_filter_48_9]|nr:MAG: prevent-host-death family protein [Candidatus Marinimicrobia bacterium CG_4_10_14_0_2_um_filter_48_9]